jgi:PIN domain nuclease of toxin-antitoxin system
MSEEPPRLLLDTHAWVWLMIGDEELSARARAAIERAARRGDVYVSAISVWELGMLVARGRVHLGADVLDGCLEALGRPGLTLAPLAPEVAIASTRLPGRPGADPADRILAATARAYGAAIVTRDRRMLDYARAGHVAALET